MKQKNQDRVEMNNRFKVVYRLLSDNGEIAPSCRQKGKGKFAKTLGIRTNQVDRCLQDKYEITYESVNLLCENYGVNKRFMLEGVGKPFKTLIAEMKSDVQSVGNMPQGRLVYAGLAACASSSVGSDPSRWNDEDEKGVDEVFMLPGISGDMTGFNVCGNSMIPTFSMGDIVFCTPITQKSDLRDGDVYVLSLVGGKDIISIKRIERVFDLRGNWTHLRLVSDNKDYEPFEVELGEIQAAYRVTRRLTGSF